MQALKRWFSLGLLVILVLLVGSIAQAQDGGEADEDPLRNLDREAPLRAARVVEASSSEGSNVTTILLEIPAAGDAYIASSQPNNNFGGDDGLFVGYNNTYGAERSLLWFDVAGEIPAGANVNSATLELYLSYARPEDDEPMPILVRHMATSWTEGSVTWNTEPVWGDVWDTTDVGNDSFAAYTWDVTDLVNAWLDGSIDNNGVELEGDEAQANPEERAFYSRETNTELYPRLLISYDTTDPEVRVDALPVYSPRTFNVSWTNFGDEDIAYYDIQYRVDGGGWVNWLTEVDPDITSADFTGMDGRTYEFRARGVDDAGNAEPFAGAEAATTVDAAAPVTTVQPLPPLTNDASFTVSWETEEDDGSNDGSPIAYYDVQYRFNGGDWVPWQQQTLATSATFTAQRDGYFEFEARAADGVGNIEPFNNQPEADIMVDMESPFIVRRIWTPLIYK
jgi:hypothetical protein